MVICWFVLQQRMTNDERMNYCQKLNFNNISTFNIKKLMSPYTLFAFDQNQTID